MNIEMKRSRLTTSLKFLPLYRYLAIETNKQHLFVSWNIKIIVYCLITHLFCHYLNLPVAYIIHRDCIVSMKRQRYAYHMLLSSHHTIYFTVWKQLSFFMYFSFFFMGVRQALQNKSPKIVFWFYIFTPVILKLEGNCFDLYWTAHTVT